MLKTTAHRIVRWKWVDDILIFEGFGYDVDKTEWSDIDWKKVEKTVFKLQNRIYRASESGDMFAVRRLQKMLIKSWSARLLALRRVTQDNQGKKTAGVHGIKVLTPQQRLALVGRLKLGTKSKPTRRVWIDKPGTKEKRPLGIPTIEERAKQALVKLALEPEWECRFEPNSYGFRPGRSTRDAIGAIFNAIRYKPKFVLDADISKCFDCIDHKALLLKLNTYPSLTRQIRAWLISGVMDKGIFDETSQGTPQGGVISPLLANIALHGMEERVKQYAETLKGGRAGIVSIIITPPYKRFVKPNYISMQDYPGYKEFDYIILPLDRFLLYPNKIFFFPSLLIRVDTDQNQRDRAKPKG